MPNSEEHTLRRICYLGERKWATKNLKVVEKKEWGNLVFYTIEIPEDYGYYIVQNRTGFDHSDFFKNERKFVLYDPTSDNDDNLKCPHIDFHFLYDQRYRKAIERDYCELKKLCKYRALKSIYIITGSIIEAILVDQLKNLREDSIKKYSQKYGNRYYDDISKWYFDRKITIARDIGILTGQHAMLLRDLKDHRNIVHICYEIENKFLIEEGFAKGILNGLQKLTNHLAESGSQA